MLNSIIKRSLDNRLIVIILSGVLLIVGAISLMRTEVDIFPDLNAPTVTVLTEAPGMAAEDVESLVTYPIETAVSGSQGVETVRSSSMQGFSVVDVIFNDDVDVLVARQTIAERLQTVNSMLPPSVESPVIGPQSSILGEVMIIALHSDSIPLNDVRDIADRIVAPRLRSIEGVSQVSILGGAEKEYRVSLNPLKMASLGVSLDDVLEALDDVNGISSGGIVNGYGNECIVKSGISTNRIDEIGSSVIVSDSQRFVVLSDVAKVEPADKEPLMGAASYNASPSVILTVTKQPKVGTIGLTHRLNDAIADLKGTLPSQLSISNDVFNQSDFISTSVSNLQSALFEGALMVVIVIFFFMMNLRATLVSLLALPMSIIVTVLILNLLGLNINTMTLGGIAIAIGSLVDDAIVDVENVYKRLQHNRSLPADDRQPVIRVVYEASKEVRMPIFNSSLIIVAGFLPLFFLGGVEGRMLAPLGVSFIIALGASTLVALTLTPVLCSYLLGAKGESRLSREPKASKWLKAHYHAALERALSRKRPLLIFTAIIFLLSFVWFLNLGSGFLPAFNEGSLTINVSAMPGITLEESDDIGRMAEFAILKSPEVVTVARKTGRAELDEHTLGTNVSEIEVPYRLNDRSKEELIAEIRDNLKVIPGAVIEIGQPISHRIDAMLSGTEAPVVLKIFGNDLDELLRLGAEAKRIMSGVNGIVDVSVEQMIDRPEIIIEPKRTVMARYGVTPGEMNRYITAALGGRRVSQVYDDGFPRDLTVRFDDRFRNDLDALAALPISSPLGFTTLGTVAEIVLSEGPNKINRENTERRIVVSANVEGRDLGSAVEELSDRLSAEIILPEGYSLNIGGRWESAKSSSRTLLLAALLAVAIIFVLLYGEFKNFSEPLIVLVNMPLAIIGGVAAIGLSGSEVDLPAIIGFIALVGIVTRNGMLLISRYNQLLRQGVSLRDAIIKGSIDRILPITMTALSSALALLPIALRSGEPGNEIQSPLAIVILGGLVSSTLLNLFIVPILFSIVYGRKSRRSTEN